MRIDKKLLSCLSHPLNITERPFGLIAAKAGLSEKKLLSVIKAYKRERIIRRFAAVLNHRKIGLRTNALVAWKVEKKKINTTARMLVNFPGISHCYLRTSYPFWPYNIYTMVHAQNRKVCEGIIKSISRRIKIDDYKVLFTVKEFKKARTVLKNET